MKIFLFISLVFIITACGGTTPEPTVATIPEPAATPIPEPTSTATPEPTATPIPEPTSTATPEPIVTDLIQLHYQVTKDQESFFEKYSFGTEITVTGPVNKTESLFNSNRISLGTGSISSMDLECFVSKDNSENFNNIKPNDIITVKGATVTATTDIINIDFDTFIEKYGNAEKRLKAQENKFNSNKWQIILEPCEIVFQEYIEEENEESIDSSKLIEELIEKGKFKFILKRKGDISVKGFIETVDTNDIVRASKILLKGHDNYPNKINCNIGKTSPDFYEKIKTLNANDEVIVTGYLSGVSDEENIEIDDCGIN